MSRAYKIDPEVASARNRAISLGRYRAADDPVLDLARRDLRFAKFMEVARKAVTDWPAFTPEQLAELHEAIYGQDAGSPPSGSGDA